MPVRGAGRFFLAVLLLVLGALCALLSWPPSVSAQTGRNTARLPADHFRQIVRQAGLIFEGTVTAIEREAGSGKIPQTYRITFRVRQGLRGVRSGATLTIREWAGLWEGGLGASASARRPRYRVGEHSVLFLYPASRAGLTSPVGGTRGKLAVNRAGLVVLPADWTNDWTGSESTHPSSILVSEHSNPQIPLPQFVQRIQQAEGD